MVDTGKFAEVGKEIIGKVITGGVVVIGILFLGGIILGLGFYIRYLRKFNVRVRIKSIRSRGITGEPIYKIVPDMGGFIENKKDKTRWFRLRGEKVDLPSPPLEVMQVDYRGVNYIDILQKSDIEYYYLLPDRIDFGTITRTGEDGNLIDIPVGQRSMKIVEGDVAYWGQLRKKGDKKMFDMENIFMKLLPYIVPVLMFMLVIFMTYLITEHWGEFATAAQALNDAAKTLKDITIASTTG